MSQNPPESNVFEDSLKVSAVFLGAQGNALRIVYSFHLKSSADADPSFTVIATIRTPRGQEEQHITIDRPQKLDALTWRFAKRLPSGTVKVEVAASWDSVSASRCWQTRDVVELDRGGSLNTAAPADIRIADSQPPRLSVALTSAAVPSPTERKDYDPRLNFAAPGAAELKYLLGYIWERLREGLSGAWRAAQVQVNQPIEEFDEADAEEQWARLVTEKLMGQPYSTPGVVYGAYSGPSEEGLMAYLQQEAEPGYPIVAECQHLCDMAAIFRGCHFPVDQTAKRLKGLFSAGSAEGPIKGLTPSGSWHPRAEDLQRELTPGSVLAWNSTEPGMQGHGSHIVFVLRIVERHPDTGKVLRIQLFDTGGAPNASSDLPPFLMHAKPPGSGEHKGPSKMYDYPPAPWDLKGGVHAPNFAGLGVPAKDPARLQKAVLRLQETRPLGFVRLVIVKRQQPDQERIELRSADFDPQRVDDWLIYASPLLRMYTGHAEDNFSIARLLWALRCHPGHRDLQALWFVDAPRGALAQRMLHCARKQTAGSLLGGLSRQEQTKLLLGCVNLASRADGGAEVLDGFRVSYVGNGQTAEHRCARPGLLGSLPHDRATFPSAIGASGLAAIPAYFRDEDV